MKNFEIKIMLRIFSFALLMVLLGCNEKTSKVSTENSSLKDSLSRTSVDLEINNKLELLRSRINQLRSEEESTTTFGGTSWQPSGSNYIYHQNGTSSWQPEGSNYIYHSNGTSSWQPEGSNYIYHQDGSTSWKPEGSNYIYNQDGSSSWKP